MAYFRRYSGETPPTSASTKPGAAPAPTAVSSSRKGRYVQCFTKRFERGECKTEATVFKTVHARSFRERG